MRQQDPLQLLIERAEAAEQAAAQRLAQAMSAADQARQQQGLLKSYESDYQARLAGRLAAGLQPAEQANFSRFLADLDKAMGQQSRAVQLQDDAVSRRRQEWQEARGRVLALQTLAKRRAQEVALKAGRQEQKQTDEAAMNSLRRRKAVFA